MLPHVVAPEQVLERAEIDEWFLAGDACRVAFGIAGEILPVVEVHMRFKVRLPRILHGRFEG